MVTSRWFINTLNWLNHHPNWRPKVLPATSTCQGIPHHYHILPSHQITPILIFVQQLLALKKKKKSKVLSHLCLVWLSFLSFKKYQAIYIQSLISFFHTFCSFVLFTIRAVDFHCPIIFHGVIILYFIKPFSSTDEHLGCFQFLLTNNARKILVHDSWCICKKFLQDTVLKWNCWVSCPALQDNTKLFFQSGYFFILLTAIYMRSHCSTPSPRLDMVRI